MDYLKELNPKQKEAVLRKNGPVLIIAGAGAGKTKTITHRILHLMHEGVRASEILAITFTNKAAKEMQERVLDLIKKDSALNRPIENTERPFVSTFHALCVHILRENSRTLGLTRFFSIFDRADSKKAMRDAIKEAELNPKEYEPNTFLSIISKEKGNNVTLDDFRSRGSDNYFDELITKVWQNYERALGKEKSLDFEDLLLKTARLLNDNPQIAKKYQAVWKYIHVDEYQDTNKVQYEIMRLLVGDNNNICVVGDVDQNIYSWRGADIRNLLNFEKDFPKTQTILLEENYRSSETILAVANSIIKKNKNRFEKNLFTSKKGGEPVMLFEAFDENDEAGFIANKSKELIAGGISPEKIAVLYRTNFQSRVLEEKFIENDVPYQVLGTRFFERAEVKDVLSFLKVAMNNDALTDLKRIINVPPRGIGEATLAKIILGRADSLSPAFKTKWQNFNEILSEIKKDVDSAKASEAIKFTIEKSGVGKYLKEEDEDRYLNVMELLSLAQKYDGLEPPNGILKLLEDAALEGEQDQLKENKSGVKLMTIHASKGLEFDSVFISGMEQDLFPHRPIDESEKNVRDEEEERRLFYVALTRARKNLFLSYANSRMIFGGRQYNVPSEFLFDIPENHIRKEERFEHSGKIIYLDI